MNLFSIYKELLTTPLEENNQILKWVKDLNKTLYPSQHKKMAKEKSLGEKKSIN